MTPASGQGGASASETAGPRPRVAMLQDGARLHYAVPIALQRAGILERAFIDWYASPGSFEALTAKVAGLVKPAFARKMAGRCAAELDLRRVVRNPLLTLRLRLREGRYGSPAALAEEYGRRLARWVLRGGTGDANAFFGFIASTHPSLFASLRQRGLLTVGDQLIAPAAIEIAEMELQAQRFPGWQAATVATGLPIFRRLEEQTWPLLDHITCASEYVRDGLVAQGVPAERITVIPYPIDGSTYRYIDRSAPGRPGIVTVGFVGGVNLRKGVPYFKEVARRLARPNLRFVMVGNVELTEQAQQELRRASVELAGPVARSEVQAWLERFDIFLFPSTCEGSATAVLEAMASGLPVVTSPNSGSLVRDDVEGHVRKYDDVEGMCAAVDRLAADGLLRHQMGLAARRRVEAFDLAWYSGAMRSLFLGLLERPDGQPGLTLGLGCP